MPGRIIRVPGDGEIIPNPTPDPLPPPPGPIVTAPFTISANRDFVPLGADDVTLIISCSSVPTGPSVIVGRQGQALGTAIPTTVVSDNELRAVLSTGFLQQPGFLKITVTSAFGAMSLNSVSIGVEPPNPMAVSPSAVDKGAAVTLDVFARSIYVSQNGSRKTQALIDRALVPEADVTVMPEINLLRIKIAAGRLTTPGTVSIQLQNPTSAGPILGGIVWLTVRDAAAVSLSAVGPSEIAAGSGDTVLRGAGTQIPQGAVLEIDGASLPTQVVSPAEVQATAPRALLQAVGGRGVKLRLPNGDRVGSASFSVIAPRILAVAPATAPPGSTRQLGVTAVGLLPTTRLFFDGAELAGATVDIGQSRVTATLPGALLTVGSHQVTLVNQTDLGPVTSSPATLKVVSNVPVPVIDDLMTPSAGTGRVNAVMVKGRNLPEDASAWRVERADGQPFTSALVVSAARVPPSGPLGQALDEARRTNTAPSAVITSMFPEEQRDGWPMELLVLASESAAPGSYRLSVRTDGGESHKPFSIATAKPKPLFPPSVIPDATEAPAWFPDPAVTSMLMLPPSEIEDALKAIAAQASLGMTSQATTSLGATNLVASGPSLVGGIGIKRNLNKPGRPGSDVKAFEAGPIPPKMAPVTDDKDGVEDGFERQLAQTFLPFYRISKGEKGAPFTPPEATGFALFCKNKLVREFEPGKCAEAVRSPVREPVVHYRVAPLAKTVVNGVTYYSYQVDYYTIWTRDDGPVISSGDLIASYLAALFGVDGKTAIILLLAADLGPLIAAEVSPHRLDTERSALLVAAPADPSTGGPPQDASAYSIYDIYTAGHENKTGVDASAYARPPGDVPLPASTPDGKRHIQLYMSKSKHSTYPFNPDGFVYLTFKVPIELTLIKLAVDAIRDVIEVIIRGGVTIVRLRQIFRLTLIVFSAVKTVTSFLRESFDELPLGQPNGDGFNGLPPTLEPIGELSQPVNGNTWIVEKEMMEKLIVPIWAPTA